MHERREREREKFNSKSQQVVATINTTLSVDVAFKLRE